MIVRTGSVIFRRGPFLRDIVVQKRFLLKGIGR